MNKTFKTKWSSLRQQYIVTDEKHVLKGKASKNTVTLAIAAVLAIASGTSSAAYVEKGVVGNQASWESEGLGTGSDECLKGLFSRL